jgi:hypothetical protein
MEENQNPDLKPIYVKLGGTKAQSFNDVASGLSINGREQVVLAEAAHQNTSKFKSAMTSGFITQATEAEFLKSNANVTSETEEAETDAQTELRINLEAMTEKEIKKLAEAHLTDKVFAKCKTKEDFINRLVKKEITL